MGRYTTIVFVVTFAGCAATATHFGREHVATKLNWRVGTGPATESAGGLAPLPPGVALEDGISEDEAVTLALWNNAAFQEALAELGFTRAELVRAGLLTNPSFSVLFPIGHKQLEFTTMIPLEALWLRPRRVALAEVDSERVAEQLVQSGLDVVRDVRVAYAEVVRVAERARLAADAVEIGGRLAELADARLRAGDASALEISATRIDVQRAREDAARLAGELVIAQNRLRAMLGHALAVSDSSFSGPREVAALELNERILTHDALAARPDLRAAELAVDAACRRAGLTRLENYSLAGLIDANADGEKGFEAGPGLQFILPIFHHNQGLAARAAAEIERAVSRAETVHDRIVLEVREANARYMQATQQLRAWQSDIMPPTEEAVAQTAAAYENGDASLATALDATRQLLHARVGAVEADAARRRAWAELERSVGRQIMPEIPVGGEIEQATFVTGWQTPSPTATARDEKSSREPGDGWTSAPSRGKNDATFRPATRDVGTDRGDRGDPTATEERP